MADDESPYCDPPAYWRGGVNGWTFAPAVADGGIIGYLGWADPTVVTGSNITTVWFQREPDGTWTTWGWKSGDFAAAVDSLRSSLAQPGLWACEDDIEAMLGDAVVAETEAPTEIESGLYVDDPMQAAIEDADDPAELVSVLADLGWAAAPTISALLVKDGSDDIAVPCDPAAEASWTFDQMILRFTYEAETSLFGASAVTAAAACIPLCWGCWSTVTAPGPWGAWTFVGSTTSPVGVLTCNYSRTRTRTRTWTGATFWGCGACPAPTVETQTQTGVTRPVPAAAGCPTPPPALINRPGSWI